MLDVEAHTDQWIQFRKYGQLVSALVYTKRLILYLAIIYITNININVNELSKWLDILEKDRVTWYRMRTVFSKATFLRHS